MGLKNIKKIIKIPLIISEIQPFKTKFKVEQFICYTQHEKYTLQLIEKKQ